MDYRSILNDTLFNSTLFFDAFKIYMNKYYNSISGDDNYKPSDEVAAEESDFLKWYKSFFRSINGYLSLTVCFFGIISNILNNFVLPRTKMEASFSEILISLAFADLLVVISQLVWIPDDSNLDYMSPFKYGYTLARIKQHSHTLYYVFRKCTVWLTVVAALWRVMAVSFPNNTLRCRSLYRARVAFVATYAVSLLICIPQFLEYRIAKYSLRGTIVYKLKYTDLYEEHDYLYATVYRWAYYILLRLLPCILVIGLTAALIRAVHKTKKNRQNLNLGPDSVEPQDGATTMLIIVLIIFLLTNGVQTVIEMVILLFRISYVVGFNYAYVTGFNYAFYETFSFLILVNSSIKFFVYMIFNSDFRETFKGFFLNRRETINVSNDDFGEVEQHV